MAKEWKQGVKASRKKESKQEERSKEERSEGSR